MNLGKNLFQAVIILEGADEAASSFASSIFSHYDGENGASEFPEARERRSNLPPICLWHNRKTIR
jgi:hypothetical protein